MLFFAEASRSCGGSDIVISPYCCTNDRLVVYKAVRQRLLALIKALLLCQLMV